MPTLHGISHENYAVHSTQLFLAGQVYPMLMSSVPQTWCTLGKKSNPFQIDCNNVSERGCFHVLA